MRGRFRPRRPRLMPGLLAAMVALLGAKLEATLRTGGAVDRGGVARTLPRLELVATAQAEAPPPPRAAPGRPAPSPGAAGAPAAGAPAAETPSPEQAAAERALLENLRARRTELEGREQAQAAREMALAAAERRLALRIEELAALQQRLELADRSRTEREEAGWRQMVKLYEGMRPREAAANFDDRETAVAIQILDRMGERRAAPVLGAMRPERARMLTAELARHRARPAD